MRLSPAERKAMRRVAWRAFWGGFFFRPKPSSDELRRRFWADVAEFERRAESRPEGAE